MNYPHLHLLINHVPILGSFAALLLVLYAMKSGSREVTRLSLWVALVMGLSVYPAYFTGDEAHEQVEDYPGFDHDTTHEHEDAAEWALVIMLATAGVAGVALYLGRGDRTEPRWSRGALLAGLLLSTASVTRTAWIGGEIRHEEIRGSLLAAPVMPEGVAPAAHRRDGESDHDTPAPAAGAVAPMPATADSARAAPADSAKLTTGKTHVHKDGTTHTH